MLNLDGWAAVDRVDAMRTGSLVFMGMVCCACSGYSTQQILDAAFIDTSGQIAATLISPANNANTTIDSQFSWTGANDAREYRLEISANADASVPVLKATVKTSQYVIRSVDLIGVSALAEQVYYWRVTTVYGTKQEKSAISKMILYDKEIIYVNTASASTLQLGTLTAPYKTIQPALNFAAQNAKTKVYVAAGTYNAAIALALGVSLQGGYNATNWTRNVTMNATVIAISTGLIAVTTPSSATAATVIDGFTIQNSTSTGFSSIAIYIDGYAPTISNNQISAGTATQNYGIYLLNNASPAISGNSIYGGGGLNSRGIYSLASSPMIYNNMVHSGTGSASSYGVYTDLSTAKVYNNTIHAGGTGTLVFGMWLTVAGDATSIANNIIFCTGGTTQYGIYRNTPGAEPVSLQNNNIFGCTGALYQNGGIQHNFVCAATGNFHTLTACGGTALSLPTGSGNVTINNAGNQLFINQNGPDANIDTMADNDWHLTTNPAICHVRGGGLTIAGITLDRDSLIRTTTLPLSGACTPTNVGFTGWSMGAYESN